MDKEFIDNYIKVKHKHHIDDLKLNLSKFEEFYSDENGDYTKTKNKCKYYFKGIEEVQYNTSTGKLFMYAISHIDDKDCSKFYIPKYLSLRGFTRNNKGKEQLNRDIIALSCLSGVYGLIDGRFQYQAIILSIKVLNNNFLEVRFNQDFVKSLKNLYFWLPVKLYSCKDKYAPHAWSIAYEVFRYLKNKNAKKGLHNRSIETLINTSNLQNTIDTERQKQLLYTPFIKSLIYINNIQTSVKIEIPEYKPKFYTGNLEIEVLDNKLFECYKQKNTLRENKLNKTVRKQQAKSLKQQGYTIKEISQQLKLSIRTINNYLK